MWLLYPDRSGAAAWRQCEQEGATLARHPSLQPELVRSHMGLLQAHGQVPSGSELKAMLMVGGIAPKEWPPNDREVARPTSCPYRRHRLL